MTAADIDANQPFSELCLSFDEGEFITHSVFFLICNMIESLEWPIDFERLGCQVRTFRALQGFASAYARNVLTDSEWAQLHAHIAELATGEGMQSPWRWSPEDLACFGLSDFLIQTQSAGDHHLHELMRVIRQGAPDPTTDPYRHTGKNIYDDLIAGFKQTNTLDEFISDTVVVHAAKNDDVDPYDRLQEAAIGAAKEVRP